MKKHDGCKRGFHHFGGAWYASSIARAPKDDTVDEIMVGMYHPGGGTTGEFAIRWMPVGGKVVPRLEIFNDAWSALLEFDDLLKALRDHDDQDLSPKQVAQILKSCGIEDLTARTRPYDY